MLIDSKETFRNYTKLFIVQNFLAKPINICLDTRRKMDIQD